MSIVAILGFLLPAGLAAQAAEGVNDQKPKIAEEDKLPRPAPDFTLKDSNGKEVQLSKLMGKIVVLEWVNYDCPFVKPHYTPETNTMGKLAEKYKDKDVVWLTVNSTNYATAETNAAWATEHGIKQTILIDSDGKVGRLYKAKTTPHLFVVDKKGQIVYQGAIDNAPLGRVPEGQEKVNYVDQALTELIAGKAVSTPKTKPYGCSVKYAKSTEAEKPA
jgi:peroxiredoxin